MRLKRASGEAELERAMFDLDEVLVIDGSRVVRELLARLMKRHSNATHALDDCEKAREWIGRHRDLSLVIADLQAPGGGGLALLEFVAESDPPRPHLLLIGREFSEEQRVRAEMLGAIGCLVKPISFQALAETLAAAQGRTFKTVAPRLYAAPPARVHLLDPNGEESQIVWNLHDLSTTGALIDTRGPVPLGAQLSLALYVEGERIPLTCEVVRVQEPGWGTLPGVGVRFLEVGEAQRAALEREIQRREPRSR